METNNCLVYNKVPDVYEKLLLFCFAMGFKVKDSNERFYHLKAVKKSFFFWKRLLLDLKVVAYGKQKVEITTMLFKNGKRQPKLENEYITAIENFL
jgi:hypothetical protein